MRRFLGSTRGRLVLLQALILTVASAVTAAAIFETVSAPERAKLDNALYGQWQTIVSGLQLQDGQVVYPAGPLPATGGDNNQVPIEIELHTKDGLVGQTAKHVLPAPEQRDLVQKVLGGNSPGLIDTTDQSGSPRRVYAEQQPLGDPPNQVPVVVIVSASTADLQSFIRRLVVTLLLGGALVVLVGVALAWFLVGRTLRTVLAIASAARSVSEHDLHRRVDVPAPDDELGELKATFNQMLARLEQSFASLRRFTADASHELRSPLTLIRTEVEVTLARARERDDYERVLRSVQSEVEHMSRVIDQLLLIAQADAGTLKPLRTELDVADFIEEEAARWQPVAEARGVRLEVRTPDSGTLAADRDMLRRVIDNLLDNAIRYSPSLAAVTLSAARVDGEWVIEVADQGPGVPVELHGRIFQRFSRADTVRTRRGGGAGLGLALGAAVAGAHGGALHLIERNGAGAVFQLRLP